MLDETGVRLAAALAEAGSRRAAAQALASHVGAEALLALTADPATGALIPAVGLSGTLPGGPAWRAFLKKLATPGEHRATLGYPALDRLVPVLAHSTGEAALVFLGGRCDVIRLQSVVFLLPLIGAMLRAEGDAMLVKGELRVAQEHAREAEAMARSLDAARAEVERTVAELDRQARALDQARARAEEATRAKDEFLAMLGHELRNPLSPIVTALQLMRLRQAPSHEQEVIERQVTNLVRLVDDLLDVARITRGKIDLRKSRIDLGEVVSRGIEIAAPELERRRQVLTVRLPSHSPLVDGDPARLAQALANLLTNASKYSDPGSQIVITGEDDGERARIRVRDHGVGISPDMVDRVFELFVQQPQAIDRAQGGLGLGLAIVRSLVTLHGGRVWAESGGLGLGSEFVIELPRAAETAPQGASEGASGATGLTPTVRAHVLVVDDNADLANLLADALSSFGYVVRTAAEGLAALRLADEFEPDVVLLDIGLPVLDGYEVARQLRAGRRGPLVRLIAVTGYGEEADRRRSRDAGFDAHLVKPVDLDELQRLVADLQAQGRAASRERVRSSDPEH
ncbi:MAG TPA: ATP-binding protein [Vicinamibacterales bacterium]|nr:ATP-binding protein [Vicinamibacterales bacterium]